MKIHTKKGLAILMSGAMVMLASLGDRPLCDNNISAHALTKADEVLQFAESRLGMGGPCNEASAYYGFYGEDVPWCAMFVYYCAVSCGVPYAVPDSSYCDEQYGFPGGVQFFKKLGRWEYSYALGGMYFPKRADIVYFDWNHDRYADHVGYILGVDNYNIYTIEGNSGDMVQKRSYSLYDSCILGYGKPDFSAYDETPSNTNTGITSTAPEVSTPMNVPSTSPETNDQPDTSQNETSTGAATGEYSQYTEYYVTSPIGAWFRSAPEFYDNNKIGIIDTGTTIRVYSIENNWAKASFSMNGGASYISGYIHTSTINYDNTPNISNYSPAIAYPKYQVTSPIGCWFRNTPEIADGNKIEILNTWQTFEVISKDADGWLYSRVNLDGNITYGYVYYLNVEKIS